MEPLKIDFHIHTREDPKDRISYSAFDLVDMSQLRGFDALAITNHETVTYSSYLRDYAKERGIIILPGVEATIEDKHIILINFSFKEGSFHSLSDILKKKDLQNLVIAPHPFFPGAHSLDGKLEANWVLFDGIEYCHFYSRYINYNTKAVELAKRYNLPLIATSDAHTVEQIGLAYSLVEAEKDMESIILAVKEGKVVPVSEPLSMASLIRILVKALPQKQLTKEGVQELILLLTAKFFKTLVFRNP